MTAFTMTPARLERLMDDLNNRGTVTLKKSNGTSVILRSSLECDEYGDMVYLFTIQPATLQHTNVQNAPMIEDDLRNILAGEKFETYFNIFA